MSPDICNVRYRYAAGLPGSRELYNDPYKKEAPQGRLEGTSKLRTGRPRCFCKEEALDKAMTVFWRQGYEGASISDLTKAMGINSPSLYACFGSKEGLFRSVLERYDQRREMFMTEVLSAPTAAAVAEAYLMGVVAFTSDTSGRNPPGCLMVQGGLSCGEKDIPEMLARHRAEKEAMRLF